MLQIRQHLQITQTDTKKAQENRQILDSKRVWRLAGLLQEASGEIEYAEDNYNENIRNDPGDAASIKRIISLYKHQGTVFEFL